MSKDSQHYQDKEEKLLNKYECIKRKLPDFAVQFLNSKHKITQSSKNLYATELLMFFEYIVDADERYFDKQSKDLNLDDISDYKDEFFDTYVEFLRNYKEAKKTGNNDNSVNHKLIIVRNLYKYFHERGILQKNPLAQYERHKEPENKTIIRMTPGEVDDMIKSVSYGVNIPMTDRMAKYYEKTKQRDIAIVKLLLGTGIRVSELVGADIKDIDFRHSSLTVVRKGNHEDIVYFNEEVSDALIDYVEGERKQIKTEDTTPLFYSLRGLRMSVGSVERIVKRYSADIIGKKITPHKLRSTYGTQLYKKTGDLALVQDALGHASPDTTKRSYVDSHEENMKKAGTIKLY